LAIDAAAGLPILAEADADPLFPDTLTS